ncbi:site-specific integrase [Paenibacillus sp. FSL R7-0204]|uniref:Integrase n=2 Tax=Paenibacillus silagei TaxID=1670801 RepID=A0ABS4NXV8_9BACL|nr:integrase [Paenibacillus silagei]
MASIQKRGPNSYLLVVEAGYNAKGKRIKKTKTIKSRTKKEAEAELARFIVFVESGMYRTPAKMYLPEFVVEWKTKYAQTELSPLTLKTYNFHLENHILPALGHLKLDEIKPMHILSLLEDLRKPGARKDNSNGTLSSGTIEYIYRVMKNVFSRAKDWSILTQSPMASIKKPKVTQQKLKFYDEQEAAEVITLLYKAPIMWRLFCICAILGGFRRGELLALEWSEVDFENHTIKISKSISLTIKSQAIIKLPKTDDSIRTVDMPVWYMEELKIYKERCDKERIALGEKWLGGDKNYVFHAGFGKPIYHTQPSKWWKNFVEKHEFKYVRFHDLRHSCATILLENDVSLKAIQERLGHSKQQVTADLYTHVSKFLSRETANKFNKLNPNIK